ncbi:MAG: hypothetical protein FJW34_01150 [Acidobacteria bacterium]|nr:hypothetical protein [Acidobacteriota bacterium]
MVTPPVAYADQAAANRELESYIIAQRGRRTVPGNLDPAHVDEFIRRRLSRGRPVRAFCQARRVADYYDLRSVLDHYERMLRMDERNTIQFDQSVYCIMTLAESGDESHDRKASQYFEYLVRHPLAGDSYELLVESLEALGWSASPRLLADRMAESVRALEARGASEREAAEQSEQIKQYLYDQLPRVVADRQLRQRVLSIPDPGGRLWELCRLYAGWGENDTIELSWWSARWIRRAARAGQGPLAVDAFRQVMREIEVSGLPKEERRSYRVLMLRAIRFLGGPLEAAEQSLIERPGAVPVGALDRVP